MPPSVTYNPPGNILATGTSLAASGTTTATVDLSSGTFGGWLSVVNTAGGAVAGTSGCQVEVFAAADNAPNYDNPKVVTSFVVPSVVSATRRGSVKLPIGKFQIKLTNLDATNAISVGITSNPIA